MLFPADVPKLLIVFSTPLQTNTALAEISVEARFLKNLLLPLVVRFCLDAAGCPLTVPVLEILYHI